MYNEWLIRREMEQGHSLREVARRTRVSETELQTLLTTGHCLRSTRHRLEQALVGVGLSGGLGRH